MRRKVKQLHWYGCTVRCIAFYDDVIGSALPLVDKQPIKKDDEVISRDDEVR